MRKNKAEKPKNEGRCGSQIEHVNGFIPTYLRESQSGNNPANRSKHSNQRKFFFRISHVAHGNRVGQCERREVSEHVSEESQINGVRGRRTALHQGSCREHNCTS